MERKPTKSPTRITSATTVKREDTSSVTAQSFVDDHLNKAPQNLAGPANETYVKVNGKDVLALLDTGSKVSCISQNFYATHLSHLEIKSIVNKQNLAGPANKTYTHCQVEGVNHWEGDGALGANSPVR